MNTNLKVFLGFLAGAIIGAGGTYLYMKKTYDELLTTELYPDDEYDIMDDELEDENEGITLINPRPELVTARKETEYTDYTKYGKKVDIDPAEQESPEEDGDENDALSAEEVENRDAERQTEVLNSKKKRNASPECITEDQYGSLPEFDTFTLIYYMGDQTLVLDEDDEPIDNEYSVVGNCLNQLNWDQFAESGERLYIRNYKLRADYEVMADPGEFYGRIDQ